MITAQLVKELRDRTGISMMDCKSALTETDGDIEKAIEVLRKKSVLKACLLYTSPSPRDLSTSRMPSSA